MSLHPVYLLGHPVGPGVVIVVIVGLIVGVLRDLHSLEIFLYLTRSKAGDDRRAGTGLCRVPNIAATVYSDSSESSTLPLAQSVAAGSPQVTGITLILLRGDVLLLSVLGTLQGNVVTFSSPVAKSAALQTMICTKRAS